MYCFCWQMDPFLHLVQDTKLQAVKDCSEETYGSPEDDNNALKSLSAVELTQSQSRESMASTIMNNIRDLPDVTFHIFFQRISYIVWILLQNRKSVWSKPYANFTDNYFQPLQSELQTIRSQLLSDFSPDDMCPTSALFFELTVRNPGCDEDSRNQEVIWILRIISFFRSSSFSILTTRKWAGCADQYGKWQWHLWGSLRKYRSYYSICAHSKSSGYRWASRISTFFLFPSITPLLFCSYVLVYI